MSARLSIGLVGRCIRNVQIKSETGAYHPSSKCSFHGFLCVSLSYALVRDDWHGRKRKEVVIKAMAYPRSPSGLHELDRIQSDWPKIISIGKYPSEQTFMRRLLFWAGTANAANTGTMSSEAPAQMQGELIRW